MAGLDPAIHAQLARIFQASVDARIKSGHDDANDRFRGLALLVTLGDGAGRGMSNSAVGKPDNIRGETAFPMAMLSYGDIANLIGSYGYVFIAAVVAVEGMGIPLPGELTLVIAALLAAKGYDLSIVGVIAAAAVGAVIGDNTGFWLGRWLGYRVLVKYGHYVRLTESRIKLGQYLFLRRGAAVVFCARFIAVLRALSGFVAGANRMPWRRFAVFNAAGGTLWAIAYGGGAYTLGSEARHLLGPIGIVLGLAALVAISGLGIFVYRNEKRLTAEAERALPGPVVGRQS
jgi:membrane protein DedA with SNARE-associated domain